MTADAIARLRAADPLGGELPASLERMPWREHPPARRWGAKALVAANLLLIATVLLHAVDHAFIQERGVGVLSFEVTLGAVSITGASILSLAVALRQDRRAPLIALLAGPWIAAAVIVGHFIPHWSEFSDPYKDAGVEAVSYVLASAVVAAGVVLAVTAASTWRRHPRRA